MCILLGRKGYKVSKDVSAKRVHVHVCASQSGRGEGIYVSCQDMVIETAISDSKATPERNLMGFLSGIRTVAVDGAVGAGLLAVTLDLLAATLVASAGDSSAFLDGLRRRGFTVAGHLVVLRIGLDTVGRRRGIVDGPVAGGLRLDGGSLVVGHDGGELGIYWCMR